MHRKRQSAFLRQNSSTAVASELQPLCEGSLSWYPGPIVWCFELLPCYRFPEHLAPMISNARSASLANTSSEPSTPLSMRGYDNQVDNCRMFIGDHRS